jgi:glycosyltransferase involved in cell wall biosynthesis
MPAVYKMGDIFILPSVGPGETWGLAVNEAMACGKPVVVSTKAGCAVDLVKDNINGITIDPSDKQKCADLIIALSQDRKAMQEMGQQSEVIIQRFSFKNIVDSISNLLFKLKI